MRTRGTARWWRRTARSGVGRLILVDYDRICVTKVNRQVHAMKGTLGKSKVEVMAERLRLINPDATIETRAEFYAAETSARLLVPEPEPDVVAPVLRPSRLAQMPASAKS